MNEQYLIVLDYETCAKIRMEQGHLVAAEVEPVQLAAVALDPATLEVVSWGGAFDSLMCPEGDWRDRVDPNALRVNRLRVEDIAAAPPRAEVWQAFARWVRQFNPKGGVRSAPLPCGKNIRQFDLPIAEWMSRKYGTSDDKGLQKLFHRRPGAQWGRMVDLEDLLFHWFEGPDGDLPNLTMDEVRDYTGLSREGAHNALTDVYQTAELIKRFLWLHRKVFKTVSFRNSCADYRVPARRGVAA